MAWRWFGVKTLYRTSVHGKPRRRDRDYDETTTLVEERVILVRARSHAEAHQKAEAEGDKYARASHVNPYGQQVRSRRVLVSDSFEMFDPPGNLREVWSSSYALAKGIRDRELMDRALRPDEPPSRIRKRKKFLNREFAGDVR